MSPSLYIVHTYQSHSELLQRSNSTSWIFASCPPDASIRCVSPGFYAVIGASAMLGGVTRMTSKYHDFCSDVTVLNFTSTGSLSCRDRLRAHGCSLTRPPYHDFHHGLQMGRRLPRQGRHILHLDCYASVSLAATG